MTLVLNFELTPPNQREARRKAPPVASIAQIMSTSDGRIRARCGGGCMKSSGSWTATERPARSDREARLAIMATMHGMATRLRAMSASTQRERGGGTGTA